MRIRFLIFFVLALLVFFIYCFFNYQFWSHIKTSNLKYLTEYKSEYIKGLRGNQLLIHLEFEKHLDRVSNYAKDSGIKLSINQSYRPTEALVKRAVVDPSTNSNHLAGFAIDFNVLLNSKKYFSKDLRRENLNKLPQVHNLTQSVPVNLTQSVPVNLI